MEGDGMPADDDVERKLPSAVRITEPAYRGSPRHAIGQEQFVLKTARRDAERVYIEEWVNEIVAYRLGVRLGVPVPETNVKRMETGELRLSSSFYSPVDLLHTTPVARARIANIGDLPGLMVLDQLVFNVDRREDHVMLTGDPQTAADVLWYAIDHGHAFRGPEAVGLTVSTVNQLAQELAPVGIDYHIEAYADFGPWLARLEGLGDAEIDGLVQDVVNSIVALGVGVGIKVRLEFRGEIVRALLKRRRDVLPRLLHDWCRANGKPDVRTLAAVASARSQGEPAKPSAP